MALRGWCMTGHHQECERRGLNSQYGCECCEVSHIRKPKRVAAKRTKTAPKPVAEPVKLNKDGSVPKKRGRPKGSKNKPKVVPQKS